MVRTHPRNNDSRLCVVDWPSAEFLMNFLPDDTVDDRWQSCRNRGRCLIFSVPIGIWRSKLPAMTFLGEKDPWRLDTENCAASEVANISTTTSKTNGNVFFGFRYIVVQIFYVRTNKIIGFCCIPSPTANQGKSTNHNMLNQRVMTIALLFL